MGTIDPEYKRLLEDMIPDYIALTFKGQAYESAITFVEVLLEKLREGQQNSESGIIKDIFGR